MILSITVAGIWVDVALGIGVGVAVGVEAGAVVAGRFWVEPLGRAGAGVGVGVACTLRRARAS
ncbi:MAG: hypothetical protein M3Q91_10680 [Acidobacteriota bacterium]|nr:hypothetical protein [Acidobacteriota bacterium]